jgi:RNA polymerase subunit RPABC4/transcription elongation factor Spt4
MVHSRFCDKCQEVYETEQEFSSVCPDCKKKGREERLKRTLGWITA